MEKCIFVLLDNWYTFYCNLVWQWELSVESCFGSVPEPLLITSPNGERSISTPKQVYFFEKS